MTNPMLNESLRKRWNDSVVELARLLREFDCLGSEMGDMIKGMVDSLKTMDNKEDFEDLSYALSMITRDGQTLYLFVSKLYTITFGLACVAGIPAVIEGVQDHWAIVPREGHSELAFDKLSAVAVSDFVSSISNPFYKLMCEDPGDKAAIKAFSEKVRELGRKFAEETKV